MLPKFHILYGLIFSCLLVYFFNFSLIAGIIIFLASFLIDLDHYFFYAFRKKDLNLKRAYIWHKNIPKNHKPIIHIFHSIEFLALILILAFYQQFFLFLFIGLFFHSISDLIQMISRGFPYKYYGREYFLIRYLLSKNRKKYF